MCPDNYINNANSDGCMPKCEDNCLSCSGDKCL